MRKPHCTEQALLKRRDVIKGGAVVLASAFFPFSIEILNAGSAVAAPPAPSGTGEERILWNSCNVNCGSRCALRVHVKDGVITRVETDNTGDDRYGMQQLRACPRGRSMRQRIYPNSASPIPCAEWATEEKANSNVSAGRKPSRRSDKGCAAP